MSSRSAIARALLEPALRDGDLWADVEARLGDNTAQLWMQDGGALVTEIWGDCLHVWLGGGRLGALLAMRPPLEKLAQAWGLSEVTISGRLGWDRLLAPFGYARDGDVLRKLL